MEEEKSPPRRLKKDGKRWKAPVMAAAMVVSMCLLIGPSAGVNRGAGERPGPVAELPVATPTASPTMTPAPTPAPTPTRPPYDYSIPAAQREAVEMAYFSDAVFIGDSRTDGLRLYSGIKGTTFLCYKGLTVFDIMERPDKRVVTLDGEKYTVLEALEQRQFAKVYISLGINELGYNDNEAYEATFAAFLEAVEQLQPDAVIYIQNLAPVNPEKCRANKQAYWLTNDRVAAYNEIYVRQAVAAQVVLVDVASALAGENGDLPAEGTVDGVHFTKAWYQKWLAYLTTHTVPAEALGLPQSEPEQGERNGHGNDI